MAQSGTAERKKLKRELEDLGRAQRIIAWSGNSHITMGHATLRDPKGRGFWIKKKDLAFEELFDPDDFILVGFDGSVVFGESRKGSNAPIRHNEWPIHSEIFKARPEVNAIVHMHPMYGAIFASTNKTVKALAHEGNNVSRRAAYYRKMPGLITTVALGQELAATLGDKQIVLMKNHGITTCGIDLASATMAGIYTERACKMQIMAKASGYDWTPAGEDGALSSGIAPFTKPIHQIYDFYRYYERMVALDDKLKGHKTGKTKKRK